MVRPIAVRGWGGLGGTAGFSVGWQVTAAARARGVATLDVSLSGSTPQAEEGSLVVLVGGDRATLERCRPILETFAKAVFHMGPNGSGPWRNWL